MATAETVSVDIDQAVELKITQRLELGWRPLNGGLTLMTLLLRGARFVDGIYILADVESPAPIPANVSAA